METEHIVVLDFAENGDVNQLEDFMEKTNKSFSEDSLKEFLY